MKILTEDDAYQIVNGFIPGVDRVSFRLVNAICRQQRIVMLQLTAEEYANLTAGVTTLRAAKQ